MDSAIEEAIREHKAPGGVLWLESGNRIQYVKAYGNRSLYPQIEKTTADTLYDAASLTKVVATTPCVMKLIESGSIELDAPVWRYLPRFRQKDKDALTVRHLLTHTSGLRPGLSLKEDWRGHDEAIRRAYEQTLESEPGTQFRYSDINFILLGELVRRLGGQPLNEFAAREIFEPLGMNHTGFLPSATQRFRIAPTTESGGELLQGVVHDPTSRRMGGVAGHAGLFLTARDLARFARMLLNGGELDGVRIFKPESVRLMTSVQSPAELESKRGLGWDIDTSYSSPRGKLFPKGSFGHTGWTGTSLWVDPRSQSFVIFLSNRNHPTEDGSVISLRRTLGTLAALASGYSDNGEWAGRVEAEPSPAYSVRNGVERLHEIGLPRRVGLITNHTGVNRSRKSSIEILLEREDVELKALFSPEHGLHGKLDEKVQDGIDRETGLKIYSLYGDTRKPAADRLKDVDALVFDIQDIGCRFYTYISTMTLAMEAAAENGKTFVVLDRVNPINGIDVDGPVHAGKKDFVGIHDIPVRHGMTVGELAAMINEEKGIHAELRVVPCEGWRRDMCFDGTGLPWIHPSPNMRSLTEAILYPGVGLLETTELSVGRGTDTPFEVVGAPYLNDVDMARALNELAIPGVSFIPVSFVPDASVFAGKRCYGVNIHLTAREICPVIDIGIQMARYLQRNHSKDWTLEKFDRLLRHPPTLEAIRKDRSMEEIRSLWEGERQRFLERRKAFLSAQYEGGFH